MNLTELGSLSDPFTGMVVKFANGYRLHVTQRVTLTWKRQLQRFRAAS